MITVKQARVGADLTQKEVADSMGIHVQTYAKLERHPEEMTIEQAKTFSKIVNEDMDVINFLPNYSN